MRGERERERERDKDRERQKDVKREGEKGRERGGMMEKQGISNLTKFTKSCKKAKGRFIKRGVRRHQWRRSNQCVHCHVEETAVVPVSRPSHTMAKRDA